MDADGSSPRNLTQHPAKDVRPAWSPDGRRIAFVSRRDGNSEVYVMNADGSGKRNLTRDRASDDYPTWSPDGRRIAFLRGRLTAIRVPGRGVRRRYLYHLYVVNADGSGLRRLTRNRRGPGIPRSAGLVTGRADDLLRALPRQHRRERSAEAPVHTVDRRLVARRAADRLRGPQWLYGGAKPGPCCYAAHSDIYVMNADGSGIRKLTHNAAYNAEPAWSPDGRKIAFRSTRNGNRDIYVMNADGSGKRNLTRNPAQDGRPSWSPDGRRIAFVSNRDGRLEAHVMNADGSGQRSLTLPGEMREVAMRASCGSTTARTNRGSCINTWVRFPRLHVWLRRAVLRAGRSKRGEGSGTSRGGGRVGRGSPSGRRTGARTSACRPR